MNRTYQKEAIDWNHLGEWDKSCANGREKLNILVPSCVYSLMFSTFSLIALSNLILIKWPLTFLDYIKLAPSITKLVDA